MEKKLVSKEFYEQFYQLRWRESSLEEAYDVMKNEKEQYGQIYQYFYNSSVDQSALKQTFSDLWNGNIILSIK